MLETLLGIGTSLFSGRRAEKKEAAAIAAQNAYNSPEQIRARAESAGFNPLLFVGPGVGQQMVTGGTNYFGAAMAESGLLMADALAKRSKQAQAITRLEQDNEKLVDQIKMMTLRPKSGGLYATPGASPSIRQALGVKNARFAGSSPSGSGGSSALSDVSDGPVDQFGRETTRVSFGGTGSKPDLGYSDAEFFETRYGELGADLIGLGVLRADVSSTLKRERAYHTLRDHGTGLTTSPRYITPSKASRKYPFKIGPPVPDSKRSVVNPTPWNPRSVNFGAMFR